MGVPSTEKILSMPELYRNAHFATGIWRASVVRVDDPESRGRIKVRVLKRHPAPSGSSVGVDATAQLGKVFPVQSQSDQIQVAEGFGGVPTPPGSFDGIPDDALPWAEPCFPFGGQADEGSVMLPSIGSTVWVAYEQGWTGAPVWLGAWYGDGELPVEFTDPEHVRLIKTPAGHVLIFDDTPGAERIFLGTQASSHTIRFIELDDAAQKLTVRNALGGTQQVTTMDLPTLTISTLNGVLQKIIQQGGVPNKTTVENNPDQQAIMDGLAQTVLVKNNVLQTALMEALTQRVTIQNNPNQQVILDGIAQTVTIKNNATVSIVLTATSIVITAGTAIITVDAGTGQATMQLPGDLDVQAAGDILLGTGAAKGVCLDSLLTIVLAMVSVFNTHTHSGGATPDQSQVGPVFGVDSSATVLAKA